MNKNRNEDIKYKELHDIDIIEITRKRKSDMIKLRLDNVSKALDREINQVNYKINYQLIIIFLFSILDMLENIYHLQKMSKPQIKK